ncbi:MAG: hypothetical protein V7735_18530 [Photobacterium frigidiphilum]|jgi:hypothetical protein|uniref:hypothetical protein n=1 Tax=Photobacterium frigidiphilum TaxID=264736 RepID=UPI0030012CC5
MNKKLIAFISCVLLSWSVSFSVSAEGNGSQGAGGFGQQYCELPSGETIFVPWHICKINGGKTTY